VIYTLPYRRFGHLEPFGQTLLWSTEGEQSIL
jgi:hypothetical protein